MRADRGRQPLKRLGVLAAFVVLVVPMSGTAIARGAPRATAAAPKWSPVKSPSPPAPTTGVLRGVACRSSTACLIAGDITGDLASPDDPSLPRFPLVGRVNGAAVSTELAPVPGDNPDGIGLLFAVGCPRSNLCFAVGTDESSQLPLIERWNGANWKVVPSAKLPADQGGQLSSIACPTSTSCFAVGSVTDDSGKRVLIERWNGATWSLITAPVPPGSSTSSLASLSCASGPSCFAVGSHVAGQLEQTLVERWNGAQWSIVASPNPTGFARSSFLGVACPSPSACFAVGKWSTSPSTDVFAKFVTLVERWDGTTWSVVTTPAPPADGFDESSELRAISCPSTVSCFAVGTYEDFPERNLSLVERWDGASWSVETPATPVGRSAIACVNTSNCLAVGGGAITRWNGTRWSSMSGGSSVSQLSRVSCTSASNCLAIGKHSQELYGTSTPFAEQWNGTSWKILPAPAKAGDAFVDLPAVACPTPTRCFAVGYSATFNRSQRVTLIQQWDGTKWSIVPSPDPAGTKYRALATIACPSATSCLAVGSAEHASQTKLLVKRWNGARWSNQLVSMPAGVSGPAPAGIACPGPTICFVVGFSGSAKQKTFVEHWNGSTWSAVAIPNPAGVHAGLADVACPTRTTCIAVGFRTKTGSTFEPLIERWNGKTWSIVPSPTPPGIPVHQLFGIACSSATSCVAVGGFGDALTTPVFAERWNGTTWSITPVPARAHEYTGQYRGAACVPGSFCFAVGSYTDRLGQWTRVDRYG